MALTNPILDTINGMSPEQKSALLGQPPVAAPTGMSAPPKTPGPQMGAPPPEPAAPAMSTATMPSPPPSIGAPPASVHGLPTQLEKDQAERTRMQNTGSGQSQIYHKITGSEFGQNHPLLGKIAGGALQGLATGADVAGSILAPTRNAETLIPGTQAHHALEMRNLNSTIGKESEEGLKSAQTGETNAQAQNLQSEVPLHEAQTSEAQERTANLPQELDRQNRLADAQILNLLHPQAKTAFEAWRQQNPNAPVEDFLKAQNSAKNVRPDTPEQQYLDEYQKLHPGTTVGEAERKYALDTQRPPQIAPIMMMVPNPNGGATATVVHPGQEVQPGTTTAAGFNSESVSGNKQDQVAQKAKSDAQKEYQLAQSLAAQPSPTNDLALVMRYIGATKPDSLGKLRLNNNEVNLVYGTRSAMGNIEALAEKVQNGQSLTPKQRQDMLATMKLLAEGGNTPKEGDTKTNSHGDTITYKGGKWQIQ